jgi:formylglycine-generating enzyme required for sulfatase activity
MVKWNANGYRLPTEAEWEKAARGGLIAKRFPWGDIISHAQANFNNKRDVFSKCYLVGSHPTYKTGAPPYTSPVGSFAANGYGLYDMAGNVMEWCWDWYAPYSQDLQTDPRGRDNGYNRVFRGGSWNGCASNCSVSGRFICMPHSGNDGVGFRLARK